MIPTIAALVMLAIPTEERTGLAVDSVDRVEVNHFHDDEGRLVFDQLIFYDWCDSTNRFQVRAWRLMKSQSQMPTKNIATGRYDVLWHDGEVMRRVEAKSFTHTWTQHDPELRERNYLPKEHRRELQKLRTITPHESDLIED
jgi:hypothetical protein